MLKANKSIDFYHKNICIVPFVHIASRADGYAHLCCRSLKVLEESSKPLSLGINSLNEIWNGSEMKAIRLSMLKGKKLPECRNCWDEEKNGKKSKRIKENNSFLKFNHHRLKSAQDNSGSLSALPLSLELKSGNSCNLKCRTCNPLSSSLWQTELKHHEKQWQSSVVLKETYEDAFHLSKQITKWHETDMFFKTIKKISQSLRLVYITGGEPLLIKSVSQMIDYFININACKDITLRINSNITVWKSAFFNKISRFKLVEFYPSIDAVGERNDWLRSPSRFSKIEKNIEKLILLSNNVRVEIECTVSVYNVLYISELIQWTRRLAKKLKAPVPFVYFNILHQPDFQNISVLTKTLKQEVIRRLQYLALEEKDMLYKSEIEGINYIFNTLRSSLEDTEKIINLRSSLKEHTTTLDRWRQENFSFIFPELVELLN